MREAEMSKLGTDLKKWRDLLRKAKPLLQAKHPAKTFLEIAGLERVENACSDILKFFLNPNEEHGLGDLVLRSLLEIVEPKFAPGRLRAIQVCREFTTDDKNRIDLVITGDTFVLGIENKLEARLQNPLDDYAKALRKRSSPDGKEPIQILLTLHDLHVPDADGNIPDFCGFEQITYTEYFKFLKRNLRAQTSERKDAARYRTYLKEFIDTIEHLQKDKPMDAKEQVFFSDNEREIKSFYVKTSELMNDVRSKGKQVWKCLENFAPQNGIEKQPPADATANPYSREFVYSIFCYADLNGHRLGLEVLRRARGWRILAWPENQEGAPEVRTFIKRCGKQLFTEGKERSVWTEETGPEQDVWEYAAAPSLLPDATPATVAILYREFVKKVGAELKKQKLV